LIEETRALGARVEVVGDATRASPAPGEAGNFRLFVAAPNGAPNLAYAFTLCGVTPTNSGFPPCKTAPFASVIQGQPSTLDPALDFQVPADLDVQATPHGFVSGVICPDGDAEADANGGAHCAAGPSDPVGFEFDFAGPGEDNGNPTLSADSVTLDGAAWAPNDATAGCGASPTVSAGSTRSIGVKLQASDFDSLVQRSAEDPARETLLVSHFSSAGKLAHTLASLTPDTPELTSEVSWQAPPTADPAGSAVHFYFVVRDARGGEDFATRALCVVP
jgi:hypothetical protein